MKTTKLFLHGWSIRFLWDCWNCGQLNVLEVNDYRTGKNDVENRTYSDLKEEDLDQREILVICSNCRRKRKALISLKHPYDGTLDRIGKLKRIRSQWEEEQAQRKNQYIEELKREHKPKKTKKKEKNYDR